MQVAFYLGTTTTCTAGINHGLQSNAKACNFTASDGTNLFAVWDRLTSSLPGTNSTILLARSTDQGVTAR